jgi:predicted Zn-dependent protease
LVEHALQKAPREPDFIDTLGLVYLRKHLGESAARVLGDLSRKYPDNPLFRYHYGLALFENGQKVRAKTELEAALRRSPSKDVRNDIGTTLAMIK